MASMGNQRSRRTLGVTLAASALGLLGGSACGPGPGGLAGNSSAAVGAQDTAAASQASWTEPSTYSSWWLPPSPTGYYNIDSRVRIDVDPGPSVTMFFSTQFWFTGGDADAGPAPAAGYMGIQDGAGPSGKIAIVSIWGATAASPDADSGSVCSTFDEGGTGYHCSLDYPWVQGHVYRSRIWVVDGNAGLWQASIKDETTGVELGLGNLTVAPGLVLDVTVNNFTENFGQNGDDGLAYPSCTIIPAVSAAFFAPTGNDLGVTGVVGTASVGQAPSDCADAQTLFSADASYALHELNSAPNLAQPSCGPQADGSYCGRYWIAGGDANSLYRCSGGSISYVEACPGACQPGPGDGVLGQGTDSCQGATP